MKIVGPGFMAACLPGKIWIGNTMSCRDNKYTAFTQYAFYLPICLALEFDRADFGSSYMAKAFACHALSLYFKPSLTSVVQMWPPHVLGGIFPVSRQFS